MPIATLISGFVFAFISGWLMSLVVIASLPALAFAGIMYVTVLSSNEEEQEKAYSKAGGRAEQALSGIKTIKQLNGEAYEGKMYE